VAPYDNLAPSITCPSAQIAQLDGNCEFGLSDFTGLAVTDDNCSSLITVTQSPAVGSTQSSNTIVTLTASDDNNNTSSCSFVVQPEDNVDPVIVCPSNLVVELDQNCVYSLADFTAAGVASDNCSTVILVSQSPLAGTSVTSVTAVTLTANDGNGNSSTCSFNVTPEDNTPPTVVCAPDQNVSLNTDCQFEIADYIGFITATDNCSSTFVFTQSPSAGTLVSSTSSVTLTAQDGNGNTASCSFAIIPADETAPVITCPQNQDVSFNSNCAFVLPDYTGLAGTDDNCSSAMIVTQSISAGTSISGSVTVTLTVDDGNGNSDDCSFSVNPSDDTDPVVTCPSTFFVSLNASCEYLLEDYKPEVVASDNCNTTNITQSPIEGTAINSTTQVLITVSDLSGNSVTCTFDVVPSDDINPTITCPNSEVVALNEDCQFVLPDYTASSSVSDNCNVITSTAQFPPAGVVILTATEVTLSVADDAGNASSCSFTITPEDMLNPVVSQCPEDQIVVLSANCQSVMPDYRSGMMATDNCDIQLTYLQQPLPGSAINGVGAITVQVAVVDDEGNFALCEFSVESVDESSPTIVCPSNQVLTLSPSCTFILPDFSALASASDACGDVTVTQSPVAGTEITGQLNATLIAEDEDGNTATCTFFVNILEYEIEVTGTDVSCDGGADGTATVAVTGGTAPYTQDWGGFNPNALAQGFYTVTVSDANGCQVVGQVTINDGPSFVLETSPSGNVSICEGASLSINAGSGYAVYNWSTGANVQSISVTNEGQYWVRVTNASGCVSNTDTITVTFYDSQIPEVTSAADGMLYCSNDSASTYQWYLNGDPIVGATDAMYCPTTSGNYYVVITDSYGCTVTSYTNEYTFSDDSPCATGIEEHDLSIGIRPNPSTGQFMVNYEMDRLMKMEMSVYDLMGNLVRDPEMTLAMSGNTVIDLSTQAEGIYVLRIRLDDNRIYQQRLVVVR
jgi:beta-lactam-binding protein with PASTA domain